MQDESSHRREYDKLHIRRAQRLRLQRLGLANVLYVIFAAISIYLVAVGQVRIPLVLFASLFGVVLAINVGFLSLIISGRNLRLRDPSLTVAQILAVLSLQLLFFWFSRTVFAQDIYLIAFLVALLFGALQLEWRAMAGLALFAFAGFVTMMLWHGAGQHQVYAQTAARAGIYAILLAWITFFASYVSHLRSRLSERNEQLHAAMDRIQELAIRDELTGAFNRRFIRQSLEQEMERAKRAGTPFSVCMLDIDHFKHFNDTYGHLIGDAVLRELVDRIRGSVRRLDQVGSLPVSDQVGRFGGEEFLLVLPLTHLEGATLCAERVRRQVGDAKFETEAGQLEVTLSAGVAEFRAGETIEELVERADQALYRAKESGRNRVETAASPAATQAK